MTVPLHCSFCSRSEAQVQKLVAGGGGGYICDECVAIAARIMRDSDPKADSRSAWRRLTSLLRVLVRRGGPRSLSRATVA